MAIQKLNIPNKTDNAAKKKLVASNEIGVNETLMANEVNALVAKTNELVDATNNFTAITAFNFKENKSTYADLASIVDPQVNDAYGVLADGLIYVFNGASFPTEGNGMDLRIKPTGVVEEGNENAVSGGEVFEKLQKNKIGQWTAKDYTTGKQVIHNDIWWEAVVDTTAMQEPGVVAETIWQPIMEPIAPDSVFDYINSTNLIVKADLLPNKTYSTTSGTLLTLSGRLTTPKIPSLPNTAYTLSGGRPQYYGVFFWRADGSFISGSLSGSVGVVQPYTFTTPPDTAFMAVTPTDRDYALYLDTVQLNLGSVVLPYEPGYVNKPIIKPELIPSRGGQAYNQSLNTFDSVSFANLQVEGLLLDLPTSPTGLSTGQAWVDTSNGNTLKIV